MLWASRDSFAVCWVVLRLGEASFPLEGPNTVGSGSSHSALLGQPAPCRKVSQLHAWGYQGNRQQIRTSGTEGEVGMSWGAACRLTQLWGFVSEREAGCNFSSSDLCSPLKKDDQFFSSSRSHLLIQPHLYIGDMLGHCCPIFPLCHLSIGATSCVQYFCCQKARLGSGANNEFWRPLSSLTSHPF